MKTHTPPTIEAATIATKCRKGKSAGITKNGAYWVALETLTLTAGGDGIGQSAAQIEFRLQLRHYRTGLVTAAVVRSSWHQNSGHRSTVWGAPGVLACETAEEVIAALKTVGCCDEYGFDADCVEPFFYETIISALGEIGIPAAAASPDA